MSWQGIHGHDAVVEMFRRGIGRGRLGSTFLFVGPSGIGKRTFAIKLAQALLCETQPTEQLDPCGQCAGCIQVQSLTHPDLEVVGLPKDKKFIPIDTFIGDKQHRNREGLCPRIAMRPMRGRRKIAIIDDADHLNQEGANCLLKTLEEPPPSSVLILIGTSPQRQLPTIRSRCQIIPFRPLTQELVQHILTENQLLEDSGASLLEAAMLSQGSLSVAMELASEDMIKFREILLQTLGTYDWDSLRLASGITEFVNGAGKDAPSKRLRLRQVIEMTIGFYSQLLRGVAGLEIGGDSLLCEHASRLTMSWPSEATRVADCIDRCLAGLGYINANANIATAIDAWVDELHQATLGKTPILPV